MKRREILRVLATTGVASIMPSLLPKNAFGQRSVRYEVHGSGPVLFLGSPIRASGQTLDTDPLAAVRQGYLERLTDRYRVIVMDYPPTGNEVQAVVDWFTPNHVCADVLSVADAAGAGEFAWYGYSWGGVVGLQLAARTNRLTALPCGGWPPLGASYKDMAAQAEILAHTSGRPEAHLMVMFYRALDLWRDEEAILKFTCARRSRGRDGRRVPRSWIGFSGYGGMGARGSSRWTPSALQYIVDEQVVARCCAQVGPQWLCN